uniref:tRNA-uridine aminocarboxypropyltransferase n=1 Tax=Macrostomum lignano TaxID=282301 RepID=A0A1I8FP78_9PLAT
MLRLAICLQLEQHRSIRQAETTSYQGGADVDDDLAKQPFLQLMAAPLGQQQQQQPGFCSLERRPHLLLLVVRRHSPSSTAARSASAGVHHGGPGLNRCCHGYASDCAGLLANGSNSTDKNGTDERPQLAEFSSDHPATEVAGPPLASSSPSPPLPFLFLLDSRWAKHQLLSRKTAVERRVLQRECHRRASRQQSDRHQKAYGRFRAQFRILVRIRRRGDFSVEVLSHRRQKRLRFGI